MGQFITEKEIAEEHFSQLTEQQHSLVLINDDFNSFTHVMNCLMTHCDHTLEQAEQITVLVHHKGRCSIKHGPIKKLTPLSNTLNFNKLTTIIE